MDNNEIGEWIFNLLIMLWSVIAGLAGIVFAIDGFIRHEPLTPPFVFMFSLFFLGIFWWGIIDLLFSTNQNGVDAGQKEGVEG